MKRLCVNCGAPLHRTIEYEESCRCDYCGEVNLIVHPEHLTQDLLDKAIAFRDDYKFEDALELYEGILADDPENNQAIWGRLCCRYGVVYVEDESGQGALTCHKQVDADILEDEDYRRLKASHWIYTQKHLKEDVDKIAEIQKEIRVLRADSANQYDIFICYKQSDPQAAGVNPATMDSYDAEYLYYLLKKEGYRVFFAKETLKNMAGVKYEAAIFHAIATAKVMLVFGSKPEYLESTWVKSEWQRYIAYARSCTGEKVVIPVYRMMQAGQLPEKLRMYQAIDFDEDEAKHFVKLLWRLKDLIGTEAKPVAGQEILTQLDANTKKAIWMLAEKDGDIRQIDFKDEIAIGVLEKSGQGYASYLLGCICYEQGNNRNAVQYLEAAAKQGVPEAKEQLAFMRENGVK